MGGTLYTRFGWLIRLGFRANANSRSLLNWPMQSNGAEMMRLACCEGTETGLKICAPMSLISLAAPVCRVCDFCLIFVPFGHSVNHQSFLMQVG
jgi:hypothetical protein